MLQPFNHILIFKSREPLFIDFVCFEPYVVRWLTSTDTKTRGWVKSAVDVDKVSLQCILSKQVMSSLNFRKQFEPEGADHHSSSIVDLIDSCKSAVAFIQDLAWPDPTGNAIFMTKLSSVGHHSYAL